MFGLAEHRRKVPAMKHVAGIALLLGTVACLSEFAPAQQHTQTSSSIQVDDTTYTIVERIRLPRAVVFHKPLEPKRQPCIIRRVALDPSKDKKNCGIRAGTPVYGILGCGGEVSSNPE